MIKKKYERRFLEICLPCNHFVRQLSVFVRVPHSELQKQNAMTCGTLEENMRKLEEKNKLSAKLLTHSTAIKRLSLSVSVQNVSQASATTEPQGHTQTFTAPFKVCVLFLFCCFVFFCSAAIWRLKNQVPSSQRAGDSASFSEY